MMIFQMTRLAKLSLIAALSSLSWPAQAQDSGDLYWGVSIGPYFASENEFGDGDVKFDTGFAGTAQVGYVFDRVRTDLEVSFSRADVDEIENVDSDVDLQTYESTLNLYVDCSEPWLRLIDDCVWVKPYLGLGVGVAHLVLDGGPDDEVTSFTAHGELGLSFSSNRHIEFVGAYRFSWYESDLKGLDESPTGHLIRIGARFYY